MERPEPSLVAPWTTHAERVVVEVHAKFLESDAHEKQAVRHRGGTYLVANALVVSVSESEAVCAGNLMASNQMFQNDDPGKKDDYREPTDPTHGVIATRANRGTVLPLNGIATSCTNSSIGRMERLCFAWLA